MTGYILTMGQPLGVTLWAAVAVEGTAAIAIVTGAPRRQAAALMTAPRRSVAAVSRGREVGLPWGCGCVTNSSKVARGAGGGRRSVPGRGGDGGGVVVVGCGSRRGGGCCAGGTVPSVTTWKGSPYRGDDC